MLRLTGASGSIRERYNAFLPIAAEGELNHHPLAARYLPGTQPGGLNQGQGVQVSGEYGMFWVPDSKKWSELSVPQRVGAIVLVATQIGLLVAVLRDIRGRPAAEIKGSKRLW
ncbi:MAG TPA: hypothetical protein VEZ12_20330, partial [Herpetosiphonaceae bacterium]|nr:hypothetical protein [Herpetosiphonaceae bacterium]